jgi:hypothetical protein
MMTAGQRQEPKGQIVFFDARCPKCGRGCTGERNCPQCGLASDRMATFAAQRDTAVSPGLLAAWVTATANWDNRAAHDAVFDRAAASGDFVWVAGRYRDAARERPNAGPVATAALERIRKAAEATFAVTAAAASIERKQDAGPYRATLAILLVMVIALVGLVAYQFIRSQQADTGQPDPPPGEVR